MRRSQAETCGHVIPQGDQASRSVAWFKRPDDWRITARGVSRAPSSLGWFRQSTRENFMFGVRRVKLAAGEPGASAPGGV
ncbi:MAG: hypothetical protein K8T91_04015 [Planctomycetes bacterium]|nr:hypothetical protein [Planctomycetota bacterium]